MSVSKIVAAAASGVGGAGLDVDEVFSTFLYAPTGSAMTITNNIDLSGEGGLVWLKNRTGDNHHLFDTERGTPYTLRTNEASAQANPSNSLTAFNSNGFTIGNYTEINSTNQPVVSWTFRKAPKFFDIVAYTGNGTNNQTFNHSLGCVPGMVIIKNTSRSQDWWVWVNDSITANEGRLNNTGDFGYNVIGTVTDTTVQTLNQNQFATNYSGDSYVAYLFAHNNNDGGFGPDGDADIIKCGSYTGNGSSTGPVVDLGFEPQWLLVKNASASSNWYILDVMRGWDVGGSGVGTINLRPNTADAEQGMGLIDPNSTGFQVKTSGSFINGSGNTIIYMAIRRGPLAVPESASDVFAIDTQGSTGDGAEPSYRTTFPVDMVIQKSTAGGGSTLATRLTGTKKLVPESTAAEVNYTTGYFDYMNGWRETTGTYAPNYGYMWKRAPGYFDIVCYTGNGGGSTNITHNLGSAPGMLWLKRRDGSSPYGDWFVQHTGIGANQYINLNTNAAKTISPDAWNSTYASDNVFRVGPDNNVNNFKYIVYLFGTVAGVSKVGSVTHSGSSTDVDCGFSNGARFVLLKRTDATGSWVVFDTARGIVAGNDPYLKLNSTSAEVTTLDQLDPLSSGFQITGDFTDGDYIFYAIA